MTQSITSPVPTSSPTTHDCLLGSPVYSAASQEQQAILVADADECLADGLPLSEYMATLDQYATAAEYIGEEPGEELDTQDTTAAPEQAPAPSSTLAQANATLGKFGAECRRQADSNYTLAGLAYRYIDEFLGAAPGKAQRATAVECLGEEWRKWDEDSMSIPLAQATKRLRERVNALLRGHAVATLLGDGSGVAKGDGTRKGRGKGRADGRLPWGTLRELTPLVYREESEHAERWHILPSVVEEARLLVSEVAASGMARADVVKQVAVLMLKDATQELTAAQKSGEAARIKRAEEAVLRWGGKVERQEAKNTPTPASPTPPAATVKTPATPAASTPTPADEDDADDEDAGEEEQADVATPLEPGGPCRQDNLLKHAANSGAKDWAAMLTDCVMEHEQPDDVFEAVLRGLDNHPDLSRGSHRAIKAALIALASKPAPQANGKPADVSEPIATVKVPA